jgi:hypothetical protein
MVLESGPAKMDRYYWLGVTLLCFGLGAWFVYDGAAGYKNKNRAEARKYLPGILEGRDVGAVAFPESPSEGEFNALKARAPRTLDEVRQAFGQPAHTRTVGPGEVVEYFVSVYGAAVVPARNGQVEASKLEWRRWYKNEEEIRNQYFFALIPFAVGAYSAVRFFRAASLRVRVDEAGLTYAGRFIPFAAMKSLRDYSPKGWVDLYYEAGGEERKLRLDNQKVDKFDELVDAICTAKGYENPVRAYQAAKSAEDRGPS